MKTSEICKDERRRSDVRESPLQGIDYIEVSDDQLTLTIHFMGEAPENLEPENVRIDGGRRIRNIQVLAVDECEDEDEEDEDNCLKVTVDKPGDFSTYTLRLVERAGYDRKGNPLYRRFPGFDNRYAQVDFSFKVACPSDFDCPTDTTCPPPVYEHPEINYLAKDYSSFRQLLLDRLALTIPGWQERHIPDVGIALVEVLAYVGDYLSYYQDAVATEAYLGTARQRISVRRHARLVDYFMHEGNNARTWLFLNTSQDILPTTDFKIAPADVYFITDPEGTLSIDGPMVDDADVQKLPTGTYEAFELLLEAPQSVYLNLYAAHNEIRFYTWGDQQCCLPRGATSATLQDYAPVSTDPDADEQAYLLSEIAEDEALEEDEDEEPPATTSTGQSAPQSKKSGQTTQGQQAQSSQEASKKKNPRVLHLQPGDFLLLEEVRGANTGVAEDALFSHRQVLRLTKVEKARDALYHKNVLEVEWAVEDALLFPLCISAIGRAPDCVLFQNISVARGNLFLIDKGLTVSPPLDNWGVPIAMTIPHCEGEQQPSDIEVIAGPFNPTLSELPLTYSQPLLVGKPASQLLAQEMGKAIPQIQLSSQLPSEDADQDPQRTWTVLPDLLESEPDDLNFVVEIDNDGYAHLRFGDDNLGRAPEPDEQFSATYRIGNGPTGNIGAETIAHIVFRGDKLDTLKDIILTPRNPFAAVGGTLPEPIAQVKQIAPKAFRDVLERAITADDYATLAQLYPGVQRAAASLRWNGSGYDVLVVIDPLGTEVLSDTLHDGVTLYLEQYRRIGHDVAVRQAEYVSIELAMCVVVQPDYLRGHVEADLLKHLGNGVLPDGSKGFFHPDNLSFGDPIAVSALVAVVQAVQGVLTVEVTTLQRFGEGPNQELQLGVLEIDPLEVARLDNDPNFPEHGVLTLTMKGGR
jgi:hypothetical protein